MASVLVPLARGFEELEAVALIDVMRRAGIDVRTAFIEDELHTDGIVIGANGIGIKADTSLKYVISDDFDMIVLPGGWAGTYVLAEHPRVIELVKEFNVDKQIAAICAAPYVLKKAGVLGNSYTCYPGAKEEINHPGYRDDKNVIIDGNILTSAGPGTAVCFGLAIVERLVGAESMHSIKEGMLLGYCG